MTPLVKNTPTGFESFFIICETERSKGPSPDFLEYLRAVKFLNVLLEHRGLIGGIHHYGYLESKMPRAFSNDLPAGARSACINLPRLPPARIGPNNQPRLDDKKNSRSGALKRRRWLSEKLHRTRPAAANISW